MRVEGGCHFNAHMGALSSINAFKRRRSDQERIISVTLTLPGQLGG